NVRLSSVGGACGPTGGELDCRGRGCFAVVAGMRGGKLCAAPGLEPDFLSDGALSSVSVISCVTLMKCLEWKRCSARSVVFLRSDYDWLYGPSPASLFRRPRYTTALRQGGGRPARDAAGA